MIFFQFKIYRKLQVCCGRLDLGHDGLESSFDLLALSLELVHFGHFGLDAEQLAAEVVGFLLLDGELGVLDEERDLLLALLAVDEANLVGSRILQIYTRVSVLVLFYIITIKDKDYRKLNHQLRWIGAKPHKYQLYIPLTHTGDVVVTYLQICLQIMYYFGHQQKISRKCNATLPLAVQRVYKTLYPPFWDISVVFSEFGVIQSCNSSSTICIQRTKWQHNFCKIQYILIIYFTFQKHQFETKAINHYKLQNYKIK
ncbi:Hypothetical_protein [Hexamita inflata]|uniref:Hypothetical_protein n=1 Tax=Hexamita inflata TaxID=28002 RepID=A0ABP1GIG0_9EUKA